MYRIFILIAMLSLFSCKKSESLVTVSEVELNRYEGTWYEIARFPNRFEKGLDCVTANYTLLENGNIRVINKGRKVKDQKWKQSEGKAWVPDSLFPGQLKVSFFWPFAGEYYIMELDENYRYSLVGSPSREYLWILCRNKNLDEATYEKLKEKAASLKFDVDRLEKINQDCP